MLIAKTHLSSLKQRGWEQEKIRREEAKRKKKEHVMKESKVYSTSEVGRDGKKWIEGSLSNQWSVGEWEKSGRRIVYFSQFQR